MQKKNFIGDQVVVEKAENEEADAEEKSKAEPKRKNQFDGTSQIVTDAPVLTGAYAKRMQKIN